MDEPKTRNVWKIVAIICIFLLLAMPIAMAVLYVKLTMDKVEHVELNRQELGINSELPSETIEKMDSYTNIAIFGLDNRASGQLGGGNSDVIMIASIHDETKDVKLISVYRDTYLNIGDEYGGLTKCNAAYARGGVQAAVAMLNRNLDLNLTEFLAVDWNAVSETVDLLGGVEIEITESEVPHINMYIDEINKCLGTDASHITQAGKQNLGGVQATAYCRIRYTEGSDFRRASRQRIMLETILEKAKKTDFVTLAKIIDRVVDDISTSLEVSEMLAIAKDIASYDIAATTGFPFRLSTKMMHCGATVIPLGLEENVTELHKFMFANESYPPSSVVHEISEKIILDSGLNKDSPTDYDMSKFNDTVGKDGAFQ